MTRTPSSKMSIEAQKLAERMREKHINQRQLAALMGLSTHIVSGWFRSETSKAHRKIREPYLKLIELLLK